MQRRMDYAQGRYVKRDPIVGTVKDLCSVRGLTTVGGTLLGLYVGHEVVDNAMFALNSIGVLERTINSHPYITQTISGAAGFMFGYEFGSVVNKIRGKR